jgi:CHAD domain-containing protein
VDPAKTIREAGTPEKAAAGVVAAGTAAAAGKLAWDRLSDRDGDAGGPSRAYRLKPSEDLPEEIRRIALGQVDKALDQLEGRAGSSPAEAVHETRKGFKRQRALVRLARGGLGEKTYRRENRRYRDLGRLLAGARDADVLLETLDGLTERFSDEVRPDAFQGLRRHLEAERDAAVARLEESQAVPSVAKALRKGRNRAKRWRLRGNGFAALRPGLERSYGRGRRAFAEARKRADDESLHEWRKRVKDLWHQLQILSPTWPSVLDATADETHALSDRLGDDHDLAVLVSQARQHPDALDDPDRLALFESLAARRREELRREAFALGHRLYAEPPRRFARRLQACFDAP